MIRVFCRVGRSLLSPTMQTQTSFLPALRLERQLADESWLSLVFLVGETSLAISGLAIAMRFVAPHLTVFISSLALT